MRILSRVSDLVEVSVMDVHVRFEVPAAASAAPGCAAAPAFSLGVCLMEMGIFSTDSRGAQISAGAAVSSPQGDNMSYVRKTLRVSAWSFFSRLVSVVTCSYAAQIRGFSLYCDVGDGLRVPLDKRSVAQHMHDLMGPPSLKAPLRRFLLPPQPWR